MEFPNINATSAEIQAKIDKANVAIEAARHNCASADKKNKVLIMMTVLSVVIYCIFTKYHPAPVFGFEQLHVTLFTGYVAALILIIIGVNAWCSGLIREQAILDNEGTVEYYSTAPKESCLKVVKWLSNERISDYRMSVIEQGRQFTVGEVQLLGDYFDAIESENKDIEEQQKRDKEIDAACRKIYIEPIT